MKQTYRSLLASAILSCLTALPVQAATGDTSDTVTTYPAEFFISAQPYSAFDMLALVPGYSFTEMKTDVRGFASAAGNVLIDGIRPASKHETLETLLRRIPASSVKQIELIRPGTPGIDMQGQTLLANVVRERNVQTRGSTEVGSGFYKRGLSSPRIAGEFSRQSDENRLEISAARYRTVDDEHGLGSRPRVSPTGEILRDTDYVQDEGDRATEFAAAYEQQLAGGKLRVNGSHKRDRFHADIQEDRFYPDRNTENVTQAFRTLDSELGLHYDRSFAQSSQFELFGIHRLTEETGGESSVENSDMTLSSKRSKATESILRAIVRRNGDVISIEGGVEGALNVLDSHSGLRENDVEVPLPAANVRVEERRGEAFATAIWRMAPQWSLEAGSRFESSRLSQSGDSNLSKNFFFAKPRALLSWSLNPDNRLRLLVERRVGQLKFSDFVSSTSLSTNQVIAGNPNLEPDQTWRTELTWERHFMGSGALVMSARHEQISDLIDRIPVGNVDLYDGVGNIGDGTRNELEINLNLPLQGIGLPTGLLRATALWRDGEATDPATGKHRTISGDKPFEAALHFSHDLTRWNTRWGIDLTFAEKEREFHFDEIRTDRVGTELDLFAEYQPRPDWNIRFYANNLLDRHTERERRVYDGLRGLVPLGFIETRSLQLGPYVGLTVRKSFGG